MKIMFNLHHFETVKNYFIKQIPWEIRVINGPINSLHFLFHACSNEQPKHLKHLYRVSSPRQVEKSIEKILNDFKVVSTEEYVERLNKNKLKEDKKIATFTCDDGLRQFKTCLWPILRRYSIPCTLFLVKNFVEQKTNFNRFKTSMIMEALEDNYNFEKAQSCIGKIGFNITDKSHFRCLVFDIYHPEKFWILDELISCLEIDVEKYYREEKPFLDYNDILELQCDGVRFGSHGISHLWYKFLSDDSIASDINDGISFIQEITGQSTVEHSFPFNGEKVSRRLLKSILDKNTALTHYFDLGGIKNDVKFVTHRIGLDSLTYKQGLRIASYQYIRELWKSNSNRFTEAY